MPADQSPVELAALIASYPERIGDILNDAEGVRLKIELAVVERASGDSTLRRTSLHFGPECLFPASSIGACAVVAALPAPIAATGDPLF